MNGPMLLEKYAASALSLRNATPADIRTDLHTPCKVQRRRTSSRLCLRGLASSKVCGADESPETIATYFCIAQETGRVHDHVFQIWHQVRTAERMDPQRPSHYIFTLARKRLLNAVDFAFQWMGAMSAVQGQREKEPRRPGRCTKYKTRSLNGGRAALALGPNDQRVGLHGSYPSR